MEKKTINIRLSEEQKNLIYKFAAAEKLSVTEFILRQTLQKSSTPQPSKNRPFLSNLCTLQDRAHLISNSKDQEEILKGIDALWESLK